MADFVLIKERRIRKTNIKEYAPVQDKKLIVYFSISRYKIEMETYTFDSKDERDYAVEYLDYVFLKKA